MPGCAHGALQEQYKATAKNTLSPRGRKIAIDEIGVSLRVARPDMYHTGGTENCHARLIGLSAGTTRVNWW